MAFLVFVAILLLAFWGIFYFGIRFLNVGSSLSEINSNDQNQKVILEIDKGGEITKMIQIRAENRKKLGE